MDDTTLDLAGFTGTENWYRHSLNRKVFYTDGVKYVAEQAGAYWLIDEISLAQTFEAKVKAQEFQLWKLDVTGSRGVLTCEDGNDHPVYRKAIPFTDFPEPGIRFFYRDNVLMLPSEY